jgi:CTP:molybdopterin cytidylyltransferase MocA
MPVVTVLIFHRPAEPGEPTLVHTLAAVRGELVEKHVQMFLEAGAAEVSVIDEWHAGLTFGEDLRRRAPRAGGLIVLSGGAVPLLTARDAKRLVKTAASDEQRALTNNRYSSDVCALSHSETLRRVPALPSDNALPRWLEERAGYLVEEVGSRERLGVDLDTPLDVALAARAAGAPAWLRRASVEAGLEIPRLDQLRALVGKAHRELLVFGRSSSNTLGWLERNVRCRVRFLAEERGMRASSPLAIGGSRRSTEQRQPVATLGLLLGDRGPGALGDLVGEFADGAIIDSRVLLAHRLGADEATWPSDADRFASDLHRATDIHDPWLRELTESTADSRLPILLGGHSLVGPGVRLLLG